MYKIENEFLIVSSKTEGAELCSIFNKDTGLEYLWQAGAAWPKHAPILFPIVGQLKDNIYYYNGKKFSLERHGFARSKKFKIIKEKSDSIAYLLTHDDKTLQSYPFEFELKISYELQDSSLIIIYTVVNTGIKEMLFSIGGHPAFKVPLAEDERYEDYFLEFNKTEEAERWMLNSGLLNNSSIPFLQKTNKLLLDKAMFYDDALVFKNLQSDVIKLKSNKSKNGLNFNFKGHPYFGIWAAKDADFVCLEPWLGIADHVNSDQQLKNKEGIISLMSGDKHFSNYSVDLF